MMYSEYVIRGSKFLSLFLFSFSLQITELSEWKTLVWIKEIVFLQSESSNIR